MAKTGINADLATAVAAKNLIAKSATTSQTNDLHALFRRKREKSNGCSKESVPRAQPHSNLTTFNAKR